MTAMQVTGVRMPEPAATGTPITAENVVPLRTAPRADRPRAERAVAELLAALGYPVEGEHRAGTPQRVASALAEMLTPSAFLPTTFPNDEGYDELVVARDVPFRSLCEHHLLPFYGCAHVGYLISGMPESEPLAAELRSTAGRKCAKIIPHTFR